MGSGPPGIDVADAALKGGSPEIAVQIADNVLAHNPGNEDALLTKGEALTALGRSDEAEVAFSQVLAANPTSVSANIGLGRIMLGTDPRGAEARFLEALKREPRNNVALNDLGIARDLQGRHADAQTAYREALGVSPEMAAAQVNLALSFAMSGQSQDAMQLLQPLADKPGATEQTRHDLAAVLAMSGDTTAAARILSKDLPPDQVQQALAAFTSVQPNTPAAAATLLNANIAPPLPAMPPATSATASPPLPPPVAPPATQATANPGPSAALPPPASAPPPASTVTQTSSVLVQLAGPVESKDEALAKWGRLSRALPNELGSRQPIYAEVKEHGRTEWRVRTGGFADAGEADALCQRVRTIGATCTLVQ